MSTKNYITRQDEKRGLNAIISDISELKKDVSNLKLPETMGYFLPLMQTTLIPITVTIYAAYFLVYKPINKLLQMIVSVNVATTNNASNYWTFDLSNYDNTINLMTVNTSSISPNVWTRISTTTVLSSPLSNNTVLYLRCGKTGTAGSMLFVPGVLVI